MGEAQHMQVLHRVSPAHLHRIPMRACNQTGRGIFQQGGESEDETGDRFDTVFHRATQRK